MSSHQDEHCRHVINDQYIYMKEDKPYLPPQCIGAILNMGNWCGGGGHLSFNHIYMQ
jgi:hypothetical protein